MRTSWRVLGILAALSAASGAKADVNADLAMFDKAIAVREFDVAAAAYGRLFEARLPKDGRPVADATLDALAGRLFLAAGMVVEAHAFLALDATGDTSNAGERRLSHALATLLAGDLDAAARLFGAAETQAKTPTEKARAILGEAQAALLIRPADVASLLVRIPETRDPSIAWRSAFLSAQAALVARDLPLAKTSADRATLLANDVPVQEFALLQTTQLQAAVAAAEGDVKRVAARLAAVPSSDELAATVAGAVADRVPACGVGGVTPDDFVTIGFFTQGEAFAAMPAPIGASRAAIVPAFMRSLAGYWKSDRSVSLAIGPIMTVRCRKTAPARFDDDAAQRRLSEVMAANHLRPRMMAVEFYREDDALTQSARTYDRIEAVVGKDSPMTAPLLMELAELTDERSAEVGDVPQRRAIDYGERALELVAKLEGLSGVFPPKEMRESLRGNPSLLASWIGTLPPDVAYALFVKWNVPDGVPASFKLQLADAIAGKWVADTSRTAESLTTQRLFLMRATGNGKGAEALARARKRDPGICGNRALIPALTESGIKDRDYPRDAVIAEIAGMTIAEFDINRAGKISAYREVVAAPPMIFAKALN